MKKNKQQRREIAVSSLEAKVPYLEAAIRHLEGRNLRETDIEYGFLLAAIRTLARTKETLARTKENTKEDRQ